MDFDWRKIVSTVAPTLATALGGPLAGMATAAVIGALGIEDDGADPQAAEEKIAQILASPNPEIMLKLKEADHQFKIDLGRLGIDLERIHAEDRDSARRRQVALKDSTPAYLAVMLSAMFFGSLYMIFQIGIPEANKPLIHVMLGSLGTAWISAMTYFFGSSTGSKTKEQALAGRSK